MIWKLAYAEIFFLDKLWPDFSKNDLNKINNSVIRNEGLLKSLKND